MAMHIPAAFRLDRTSAVILLISAVVSLLMLMYGNLTYFGDAGTYLQYASDLAHFYFSDALYYRTPAYPLLIILSGYLLTQSLSMLLILQAICAALIPLIIYRTLLPLSKRLACATALVAIASLLPFIFQLTIYPEQLHMFLSLLFSLACIQYCLAPQSRKKAKFMYVVLGFLSFSRPTVIIFVLFPLCILALSRFPDKKRQVKLHLLCLFIILGLHGVVAQKKHMDAERRNKVVHSFFGKQLFYNVYMHSGQYDKPFARENGPATARVRDTLEAFFSNNAEGDLVEPVTKATYPKTIFYLDARNIKKGDATYQQFFAPYIHDPQLMTEQLLAKPNKFAYFGFINDVADVALSAEGDRLLRDMSIEQVIAEPGIALTLFKENVWPFHWLTSWKPGPNIGINLWLPPAPPAPNSIHNLSERAQYQLTRHYFTMDEHTARTITATWLALLTDVLRGGLLLSAVAGVICFYRAVRRKPLQASGMTFLIAFAVYAGQSLPISLLADPSFRYQAQMSAFLIPAAAAACAVIMSALRKSGRTA